jgi:protein-tyrosine sulfotransferase
MFTLFIRRRLRNLDIKTFALIVISFTFIIFYIHCNIEHNCENNVKTNFIKLEDEANLKRADDEDVYKYNRQLPIIFVGGVPRSGTTLMRAILDAHPSIRCGEETRVIPRIIYLRNQWTSNKKEAERLKNAGIGEELIDSAISSFILEIIVKHGKPAENLCNKDPLVLRYSHYVSTLFPNSKFILMLRDGRATVHSMITRKVTVTGFNLNSYRDSLSRWSLIIENMYAQCMLVGPARCLPVYYEKLVLNPEPEMKKILKFLNISWNEAVLHHEKYIGDEISLSKVERSSDQVIKPINLEALSPWVGKIPADVVRDMDSVAPMLRKLGYDPNANPPNYGEADSKIKENTDQIRANREYWIKLAKQYSIHVTDMMNF